MSSFVLSNPSGTPGDWSHIIKQIGMSTFAGLIRTRTNTTPQNTVYVFYEGKL
ncbi:hypothetical protein ERO13_D03G089966v2 [Gossypium hirsutum]|uniref:Uncharacterized protein n=2 Tax=Gossypium TaxID=3633 RepID=A0A5J5S2Z1_GOSBA|nr:hypothetical protein ES319_D03G108400v1 [Gossypium barbadense]KAG4155082.1 hypothetical protein ERO13_D03G089966v2 [Gossypium hirsutum]TYG76483.1 hypothetical protein ES288_D03G117800v1 [Gossypium darwinii]